MALETISLTGADDLTDPQMLADISLQFPLVEWAILSSPVRSGTARYPSDAWVERFAKLCPQVNKALHLCGDDVDSFLSEDARIMAKVALFDRVQLNFNHRRNPKDLERLISVANAIPQRIIIQHNRANESLWSQLRHRVTRLDMLFDASGGQGKLPDGGWPAMLDSTFCAYAGGLGPENIAVELPAIHAITGGRPYGIDMEGKMRSSLDDTFSRAHCITVLTYASQGCFTGRQMESTALHI